MGFGYGRRARPDGRRRHWRRRGRRDPTRPIAAIVVGPEGVTVKPVYDLTKLWLAGLTTLAFVLPWLGRLRRAGVSGCCDNDNPARGLRRLRRAMR